MVISNNATAGFILGTLNKNINKKNKASGQLALGEKIRNAGDDASGYAISERMRVRIRSLDQADANVQNGASMLRVAEGAIQSQINLLRTVKAKVIDAHNDTNTDADRAIIQKEITQYYNEINDIAAETTFNGKHLLLGNEVSEAVKSWYRLDHAEKLEDSDKVSFVGSGTEVYLDDYKVDVVSTPNPNMTGGTVDKPNKVELTFWDTLSPYALENYGFRVVFPGGEETFVFGINVDDKKYRDDHVNKISLNGASSLQSVILAAGARVASKVFLTYETTSGGEIIRLVTNDKGDSTNNTDQYDIKAIHLDGGDGYTEVFPITDVTGVELKNYQSGEDGKKDSWTMDLSGYNTTSSTDVENFISKYVGQAIHHSGNDKYYEFVDSSKSPTMTSVQKINGSMVIDLNQLRSAVSSSKTLAAAFADIMVSAMGSDLATTVKEAGQVTGLKISATKRGPNSGEKITFEKGDLRDYTIDFNSVIGGASGSDIPAKLDGQGFRVYDATDPDKWFNVLFVNGVNPNDDPRPASGGHGMDIDTLVIDVSDVDSVESLVKTLYEGDDDKNWQGLSQFLSSSSQSYRAAADYSNNTITIYDTRRTKISPSQARIVNGVVDNVVNDYRNTYINDLVIQHTDKSSANIHVRIPQTTLDQVFGYKIGAGSLDDYSVMTSANREFLLGQDYPVKVTGALDKGLQYLIDANTLIGAQIVHMESADANIITETENTMAAESVIRDADIAKSAMDMATADILSQSTMAMLSQFNHNSSDVLNLLQ